MSTTTAPVVAPTPCPNESNRIALEGLMTEFFSPTTTNERKAEIEQMLSHFQAQKDSWRPSLEFLARTQNHYVAMFAISTIENTIRKQWLGLNGPAHTEIRTMLNSLLSEHYKSAPPFIRNKLIKVIVDIARTDWPHFYPEFFTGILDSIGTRDSMTLGLNMLLIASEELATPREDLSTSRKAELKYLLLEQVPKVLTCLCEILESILSKQLKSPLGKGTSTPPPSPSQNTDSEDSNPAGLFTTSPVHDGSLLHVASHKLGTSGNPRSPPLDSDSEEVSTLALKCLAHLFTWIPLSVNISERLLTIIFHFATLGAQLKMTDSQGQLDASLQSTNSTLGILAMGAINELMYKNCVPPDYEKYLLQMFTNTFHLLQSVVHEAEDSSNRLRLDALDDTYVDKLTEFLRSFVSSHLRRFESNAQFPVIEFLALLFKYTFQQTRTESFFSCLETWGVCIDLISASVAANNNLAPEQRTPERQALMQKYHEAMMSLVTELLKRIQFRHNRGQLDSLDDTNLDDDDETEWQQYLRYCIETIMKVAELMPNDVLRMVYVPWKETSNIYLSLDKHIAPCGTKLNIVSNGELESLLFIIKDFSTLLQVIGRINNLFIGGFFYDRITEGNELIKELIVLASFSGKFKFYCLPTNGPLSKAFVCVQAQTLASLKAWCPWLTHLHTLSLKDESYLPQCRDLTLRIMVAVAPVVKAGDALELTHSAAHFMVTLTGTVRPPSIWKLKEFTELYSSVSTLKLNPDDKRLMIRALSNVLLLPWPGLGDQRWEERQKYLSKFLRDLTGPFRMIQTTEGFAVDRQMQINAQPIILENLHIIGDLVENVMDEVTRSKTLCYECVKDYIDIALWLFPIYVQNSKICEELFHFFYIVFDALSSCMGATKVESAIQVFLSLFTKEQLAHVILQDGSAGTKVVEKFLGILTLVIKEPVASFRKFIPNALSLCMDDIYPLIAEKPTADIKVPLYSLLTSLLLHNWRYFFTPSARKSLGAQPTEAAVMHKETFLAVMQAYGQSFLQPDVTVFQANVNALMELNKKFTLFHKPIFTENLTIHFLTVLLQVLIHRSHDLLKDEIISCIFEMAKVDFNYFFNDFITGFLQNAEGVDSGQQGILKNQLKHEKDLPSFTSNINRLINDLRYYKLCNASLPAGSVKF